MDPAELVARHCAPREKDEQPLDAAKVAPYLDVLHDDWTVSDDGRVITRIGRFGNYYETMAFVNAVAWIAHREDHHPELVVGYNHCAVHFSTHSVGGLSENDFICAAKIDGLLHSA